MRFYHPAPFLLICAVIDFFFLCFLPVQNFANANCFLIVTRTLESWQCFPIKELEKLNELGQLISYVSQNMLFISLRIGSRSLVFEQFFKQKPLTINATFASGVEFQSLFFLCFLKGFEAYRGAVQAFMGKVPVLAYQKEVSRALVEITLFFLEKGAVSCSTITLLQRYAKWSKLIFKKVAELGKYGRNGKRGRMAGSAQGQQRLGGLGRAW